MNIDIKIKWTQISIPLVRTIARITVLFLPEQLLP
jgi:hypothetical protein